MGESFVVRKKAWENDGTTIDRCRPTPVRQKQANRIRSRRRWEVTEELLRDYTSFVASYQRFP